MNESFPTAEIPSAVRSLLASALPEVLGNGILTPYHNEVAKNIGATFDNKDDFDELQAELAADPVTAELANETYEEYLEKMSQRDEQITSALHAETFFAIWLRPSRFDESRTLVRLVKVDSYSGTIIEGSSAIVGSILADDSTKPALFTDFTDEHLAFAIKLHAAQEAVGWQPVEPSDPVNG